MADETILTEVFCAGCLKPLGLAASTVGRVFCTEACANDWPVSRNETRDSYITELVVLDKPKQEIGRLYGVTHQRVGQIASARLS